MTLTMYDAIEDLKNLITSNWATSTGGVKPNVEFIWDKKVAGLGGDMRDLIFLHPLKEVVEQFSLYATAFLHEAPIVIDIRTYSGLQRHNATIKEVLRILKANVRSSTGFIDLRITGVESFNRDYRNIYRAVIDVVYREATPT